MLFCSQCHQMTKKHGISQIRLMNEPLRTAESFWSETYDTESWEVKSYRTWKLKLALQQNMIWQTSDNVYINFRNSKCMCQMFNSVLKMFLKAMNFSVKWKNFWWIWRWDNLIVREWDRYLGHKKNNCMFPVSRLT